MPKQPKLTLCIPRGYTPPTLDEFTAMGSVAQVDAIAALNRHHANISGPEGECTQARKPLERLMAQFQAIHEQQWREFWAKNDAIKTE